MLPIFLIKKPKKKRPRNRPDLMVVDYKMSQRTVTAWPAVTCAKQNIFSALGL